jgi:hypothetical protein
MKQLLLTIVIALTFQVSKAASRDSLIISTFYQGHANNCASVALIKAAMLKYGYKNIFETKRIAGGFQITLKDGTMMEITEKERISALRASKFDTAGTAFELGAEKDSVLYYAYLSYACIAKFTQLKGYWGCQEQGSPHFPPIRNFKNAVSFISNKSFCSDYCYRLLGLTIKQDSIYTLKQNTILVESGTILYSQKHCVAVFNDQLNCYDRWLPVAALSCGEKFEFYMILQ